MSSSTHEKVVIIGAGAAGLTAALAARDAGAPVVVLERFRRELLKYLQQFRPVPTLKQQLTSAPSLRQTSTNVLTSLSMAR
mgnify:CR=1 FL=1